MSQRPEDPAADWPREAFESLLSEARAVTPTPAALERMRRRILGNVRVERGQPACETVRADAGEWVALTPLLAYRVLTDTPDHRMVLYRFQPDGWVRAHHHHGDEETYVLEGSLVMDGERLGPGDFHRAPAGSAHAEVHSETGCLVLTCHRRRPADVAAAIG